MLFWRQCAVAEDPYSYLADKIRKELVLNFERKGIRIGKVHIDIKVDNINVEVCMEHS